MRMSKPLALVAVFGLAIGAWATQTQTPSSAKPSPPEERNSLLRMDLLQLPEEGITPPRRNIFAPRRGANRQEDNNPDQNQQGTPNDQAQDMPGLSLDKTAAPPVIPVNLRYIGFVESSRRMIALVVFQGQAIAVLEGEVVSEGIRIGKITRKEIEIVLPDSSTRLFSLEGE